MKPNQIIFLIFTLTIIGFLTYKFSLSYFSDSGQSTNNVLSASATFPVNHLVINEVNLLGGFKDEWVELYNPTSSSISVNGYKLVDNTGDDILPDVSIPAGGYGIIKGNESSDIVVLPPAVEIAVPNAKIGGHGLNDDGDKLILKKPDNSIVDQMGYATDPDIFPDLLPPTTIGSSLARHPNGTDTDSSADWQIQTTTMGTSNP